VFWQEIPHRTIYRYCKLKEEALDHIVCRPCFERGHWLMVRQTTKWIKHTHTHMCTCACLYTQAWLQVFWQRLILCFSIRYTHTHTSAQMCIYLCMLVFQQIKSTNYSLPKALYVKITRFPWILRLEKFFIYMIYSFTAVAGLR
jgi:hypothetical protein